MADKILDPQTVTTQGIVFNVNEAGDLVALICNCDVNYIGVDFKTGISRRLDIWPKLTAQQQVTAQNFYSFIKGLCEAEFLR